MKRTILIIASLAIVLIYCCGDDNTTTVNNNSDPGILRTDEFGNELGGDTTDWCMHNPGSFQFKAAYPNPTHGNVVHVNFDLPMADSIKIFILKSQTDTTFYMDNFLMAGSYQLTINDTTGQYTNTYQRIYISAKNFSPTSYCRFYGDIRFEP